MDRSPSSFDAFVTEHGAGLLRTAHLITLDHTEAEDLVQECLVQLSRRWQRISSMDRPLAYARRTLANIAFRGAEKRLRRRDELSGAGVDVPADIEDVVELIGVRQEVLGALRTLTVRQRTVLALRYFHDLSETQVADALGCSVGTVRSTTSRSLAQLREAIDREPSRPRSEN
jgi:RNA polymerase sigma-70 factor (sigma-E family)